MSARHEAHAAVMSRVAEQLGLEFVAIPATAGHVYQIRGHGMNLTLYRDKSPLNRYNAARLSDNCHYRALALELAGIPTPPWTSCLHPQRPHGVRTERFLGFAPALALAAAEDYPLIVRTNHRLDGPAVVAHDEAELLTTIREIWQIEGWAVVERFVDEPEYCLHFLDDEAILGYRRSPAIRGGEVAGIEMVVELPARWRELAVRVGAALGLRHFRVTLRGAAMDEVPDQARVVSVAPSSGVGALLILGQETAAELAARTMLKAAFAEFGVELRAD